jgi:hypothetical protein
MRHEILNAIRQFIIKYQVLIPERIQCYEKKHKSRQNIKHAVCDTAQNRVVRQTGP